MPLTKNEIKNRLIANLPGKIAHDELAPYRGTAQQNKATARLSGVLLLLYPNAQNELQTTLIKRSQYEGVHSGQIGFPGGKMKKNDATIIETALREANEEIGIAQHEVEILGKLTDVFIPVSNFIVSPVVGWLDSPPIFQLDYREVEAVIHLSVKEIHKAEITKQSIRLTNNTQLKTPCFVFNETIVWGATALMLNEFKYLIS